MLRATAAGPLLTYKPREVTGSIPGADIREPAWAHSRENSEISLSQAATAQN